MTLQQAITLGRARHQTLLLLVDLAHADPEWRYQYGVPDFEDPPSVIWKPATKEQVAVWPTEGWRESPEGDNDDD